MHRKMENLTVMLLLFFIIIFLLDLAVQKYLLCISGARRKMKNSVVGLVGWLFMGR